MVSQHSSSGRALFSTQLSSIRALAIAYEGPLLLGQLLLICDEFTTL